MTIRLVTATIVLVLLATAALGADAPPAAQPRGEHSTIVTSDDRDIRDDELADYVANAIPKDPNTGKPLVKDVKILTQGCYGGGLLDDFGRVFGPGGACAGVPWVGGSASSAAEVSYGPGNDAVGSSTTYGDHWTNALKGSMGDPNQRVSDSIRDANSADIMAADGSEHPQLASGNGGDNIKWHEPGTKHRAILFGGDNNRKRHDNDIGNVQQGLAGLWAAGGSPPHNNYIYTSLAGSEYTTRDGLFDMIDELCEGLDENTQLVLYFTNHGDTEVDLKEQRTPPTAPPEEPTEIVPGSEPIPFGLHEGWAAGLGNMAAQPDESPAPTLNLSTAAGSPLLDAQWDVFLNGVPIPLGGDLGGGQARRLPIDWSLLHTGMNTLAFVSTGATQPLMLTQLEVSSGPINQIEAVPEPATFALLAVGGLAMLLGRMARRKETNSHNSR